MAVSLIKPLCRFGSTDGPRNSATENEKTFIKNALVHHAKSGPGKCTVKKLYNFTQEFKVVFSGVRFRCLNYERIELFYIRWFKLIETYSEIE